MVANWRRLVAELDTVPDFGRAAHEARIMSLLTQISTRRPALGVKLRRELVERGPVIVVADFNEKILGGGSRPGPVWRANFGSREYEGVVKEGHVKIKVGKRGLARMVGHSKHEVLASGLYGPLPKPEPPKVRPDPKPKGE